YVHAAKSMPTRAETILFSFDVDTNHFSRHSHRDLHQRDTDSPGASTVVWNVETQLRKVHRQQRHTLQASHVEDQPLGGRLESGIRLCRHPRWCDPYGMDGKV